MVSLSGAEQAQPLVAEINKLQASFDALDAAIKAGGTIWQMVIQVYINQVSTAINVTDDFSLADSTAILNDIKNVIGTKIQVLTNELGQIT